MKYYFFYDETEHNRKINYTTVTANNYYDNFTTAIVGWNEGNEVKICKRYHDFETKYEGRKVNGELKSTTMKQKRPEVCRSCPVRHYRQSFCYALVRRRLPHSFRPPLMAERNLLL